MKPGLDVWIVKIGVALSGCDIGGVCAFRVLEELEAQGLEIGMISCCAVPTTTSLFFARGCPSDTLRRLAGNFLSDARALDMDWALANLSVSLLAQERRRAIPAAVNAVNIPDSKIVTFTDDFALDTGGVRTFSLIDAYDAFSATMGEVAGMDDYQYEGFRLCDFSVRYGNPTYPLKMQGFQGILSVSFLPATPRTPYELMIGRMIAGTQSLSDMHIPLCFEQGLELEEYSKIAVHTIQSCMPEIYERLLF